PKLTVGNRGPVPNVIQTAAPVRRRSPRRTISAEYGRTKSLASASARIAGAKSTRLRAGVRGRVESGYQALFEGTTAMVVRCATSRRVGWVRSLGQGRSGGSSVRHMAARG